MLYESSQQLVNSQVWLIVDRTTPEVEIVDKINDFGTLRMKILGKILLLNLCEEDQNKIVQMT
jgi:hypothetical protein